MNWAKKQIIETGEIIVCEGYTDVIACFQAGLARAVATCGTALAEEHFSLMRNFAKRIVLAYDADTAGQNATGRVYEWERKHEIDVVVCELPRGMDPAELARSDPQALRDAVSAAKPFLSFRVDRALAGGDLGTPEGRARAAEAALAMVAEHPNSMVRDQYVVSVADRCRLDPHLVREQLALHVSGQVPKPVERSRRSRDEEAPPIEPVDTDLPDVAPRAALGDRAGLEALRLAVHRPELAANRLEPLLFLDRDQRAAFEALLTATSLAAAIEDAPPPAAALLRRVAVEEPLIEEGSLSDPVGPVVAQLLRAAVRQAIQELQAGLRRGSMPVGEGGAQVAKVHALLEQLDDPELGSVAEQSLLDWLMSRSEVTT
jgi:DNA primase